MVYRVYHRLHETTHETCSQFFLPGLTLRAAGTRQSSPVGGHTGTNTMTVHRRGTAGIRGYFSNNTPASENHARQPRARPATATSTRPHRPTSLEGKRPATVTST
jgi:hypothetical protein